MGSQLMKATLFLQKLLFKNLVAFYPVLKDSNEIGTSIPKVETQETKFYNNFRKVILLSRKLNEVFQRIKILKQT